MPGDHLYTISMVIFGNYILEFISSDVIPIWKEPKRLLATLQFSKKVSFHCVYIITNPFAPNVPFLYPLKTSEYRKVFWCFQGVEKGCIGNKWVNPFQFTALFLYLLKILKKQRIWGYSKKPVAWNALRRNMTLLSTNNALTVMQNCQ